MKKFLPYFKLILPFRKQFLLASLFGAIAAITNGFGLPFMLESVLPKVFNGKIIDPWILIGTVLYLPIVFMIRGISGFLNAYLINYCGLKVLEEIRSKLFFKIQELSLSAFFQKKTGDFYSRILSDTQELQTAVTSIAKDVIVQPITLLGALGYLIYACFQREEMMFVLVSLSVIPVCVLPIRYVGKNLLKRAIQMQEESANLSQVVQENLQGAKEVRSYCLEQNELNRFSLSIRKFFRYQLKVIKYSQVLTPSIEIITTFGVAGSIYYASISGIQWEELTPLIAALYLSYDPIKKLGGISNHLKRGEASLKRIEEVIYLKDPIIEPTSPMDWQTVQGKIEFKNVHFKYSEVPVIENLNLSIQPGEVVALVGASGAGKSTLAQMIPKFYTPTSGSVLVDGIDLKDLAKQTIRKNIAIVSQDTFLFNDTIRSNILLGNPSATDLEIVESCKRAYAHEFIELLENGYDTMAGDRGASLSGGQKQRISIARAFLKKASILILDEATSSLDSESEMKIQNALGELVQGKTVIIIAHRFSTIQMADRIVVLDRGKVVGNGKHLELIESCESYKTLYELQN